MDVYNVVHLESIVAPDLAKMTNLENEKSHDFRLERLQFVLRQIDNLNDKFYQHISLFLRLATAVVGAGAAVFAFWSQAGITAESAQTLIRGLLGMLILIGIFVLLLVVAGAFSWFDYRREEARLFDENVCPGYRMPPRFRNFWRWHETYIVVFLFSSVAAIVVFTESQILPLIS